MSHSFKVRFRSAGTVILGSALCLALVMGFTACGGDNVTDTSLEVQTTDVEGTDTTVEEAATSEMVSSIDLALVGRWYSAAETDTLEFTSDGTMISTDDAGVESFQATYTADGSNVIYRREGSEDMSFPYSLAGDVLTLGNAAEGESITYQRIVD